MNVKKILILAGGTALLAVLLFMQPLRFLDNLFYDLNFVLGGRPAADSVVVVGIDVKSTSAEGAWPWPRARQAQLFAAIAKCSPRALALDFLFIKRDDPAGNDSLKAVFSRVPNLVLPFRVGGVSEGTPDNPPAVPKDIFLQRFVMFANQDRIAQHDFYQITQFGEADPAFTQHARYGGFLNVSTSTTSQKLREVIHVLRCGNEYFPSFGLSAVAAYLNAKPDQLVLDGKPQVIVAGRPVRISTYAGSSFVNYRGRRSPVVTLPATDVLNGAVDPARLRDRLVFVGVTDPAAGADFFITPVRAQFPGVEVWATAAMDILEGSQVSWGGGPWEALNWLLALLLFPGLALLLPGRWRFISVAIGLATVGASVGLGHALFTGQNYFWDPANHLCAWLFSVLWLAIQQADPTLAEAQAIELDPPQCEEESALLAAPREDEYIREIPPSPTATYVAEKVTAASGAREAPRPQGAETALGTLIEKSVSELSESPLVQPKTESSPTLPAGVPLDKFRNMCNGTIVRMLGSGGMADVYLIWNPRLEMYRAVKVLKPGQPPTYLTRFETEIRIFAKLNHPNIVHCYGVSEWFGLPCVEMEYVNGTSLENYLEKCGPLTTQQTLAVGILLCRALHYAHNQSVTIYGKTYHGIVHRDLKPANILLGRSGAIKLTDFGIARPGGVSLHTMDTASIVGTLPYLAPEQLDGDNVTAQTDLYALGATLYEFLNGRRAFPQTEMTALVKAKSNGEFRPLQPSDSLPRQVIDVINRSMATDPKRRQLSAEVMGRELERCLRDAIREKGYAYLQQLSKRYWTVTAA